MQFGSTSPDSGEKNWRNQLNQFVKANQQELAALAWGLWLENGDTKGTLGLDIKPKPHFVYCPKQAIEALNNQVENKLQEILGVVDAHKPEVEVLIIGIGEGQLKIIQFEPDPPPPICFEQVGADVDTLLERIEQGMAEQID
ncbi:MULTISPECIES: beta-carboxysome assembly chaperone CcmS [Cyanophyceae]|uniref:beta-carboxysome assembly chaperone CcmS n=1 Tax=Cyanophyceae TaxID=3028117 RepID=UPI00168445A2|nr:hypothetical protein [Cyanobacteria bacterium FACHB-472]MBD2002633.1 hypothetical protein [Trichocoleus sp. FACHB-40]